MGSREHPHPGHRIVLEPIQARRGGIVPPSQREAPTPVSERIQLPVQQPRSGRHVRNDRAPAGARAGATLQDAYREVFRRTACFLAGLCIGGVAISFRIAAWNSSASTFRFLTTSDTFARLGTFTYSIYHGLAGDFLKVNRFRRSGMTYT